MASQPTASPPRYESPTPPRGSGGDRFRPLFYALAALLVGIATIGLPDKGIWLGAKAFVLEVVAIIVAMIVVSNGDWSKKRVKSALTAAPNLAIMAFLVWVAISAALSPLPRFSSYEAMRHLGGGLFYFCLVYGPSIRRHAASYSLVLAVCGILASISSFASLTGTTDATFTGSYRNIQLLAAVQCILFPVVCMAYLGEEDTNRKLLALAAAAFLAVGILVTQNRSVWAASGVALFVVLVMYLKLVVLKSPRGINLGAVVVPILAGLILVGMFLAFSNRGGPMVTRFLSAKLLEEDKSFQWRIGMWNKAIRMTQRKPLLGWGIGTFPVNQALFYHPETSNRTQKQIVEGGPTLSENAHNTYLQVMAEIGIPGLVLYLSIFLTWFGTAIRALKTLQPGLRLSLLIGCIAAIVGQMISSIGNPAWEFPECSLFLWTTLGLGMAAAGLGDRGRTEAPERNLRRSSVRPLETVPYSHDGNGHR